MESLGVPLIPYISAWKEDDQIIWYEYIGQRLIKLLRCHPADAAQAFRESVIDRRVYKYPDLDKDIEEEIIPGQDLSGYQDDLREEGKKTGVVEAVYKLRLEDKSVIWLKDRANVETFKQDNACLSLGCLIDVTKEMEQKDLLERIGYFDELTKLPNRKILNRIFEINIGRVERGHLDDFVFLMIDIDHFKSINDNFGHQAGDYVLSGIAEVMNSIKRKEDEIGRYGGEEFYALSPGNIQSGQQFAERLRTIVEKTPFVFEGKTIFITISIGVASALELEELVDDQLIKIADKRLYIAKQEGRNKVVWKRMVV
jgi:diguanylate cyclase (GGDEF)-like protein